jgi:hypothetical protein
MLNDGSMIKGTITELQVGQFVNIMGVDGAVRRYGFDVVNYAGAAKDAPAAPSASAEPRSTWATGETQAAAHVQLVSPQPDVHFSRVTGHSDAVAVGRGGLAFARAEDYADLCGAPCEVTLPAGRHTLSIAQGGTVGIDTVVDIPPGKSTVEGVYVSHAKARHAAFIVGGLAMAAGTAVALLAAAQTSQECDADGNCDNRPDPNVPLLVGGSVLFFGGFIYMLAGGFRGDEAHVRVIPGLSASLPPMHAKEGAAPPAGVSVAIDW